LRALHLFSHTKLDALFQFEEVELFSQEEAEGVQALFGIDDLQEALLLFQGDLQLPRDAIGHPAWLQYVQPREIRRARLLLLPLVLLKLPLDGADQRG